MTREISSVVAALFSGDSVTFFITAPDHIWPPRPHADSNVTEVNCIKKVNVGMDLNPLIGYGSYYPKTDYIRRFS